jgi:hypothetical protein
MPLLRADKCDLCKGYGESACVKECPTGAMIRVPADERIQALNFDLYAAVMERVNLPVMETHRHSEPIPLYEDIPVSPQPIGQLATARSKDKSSAVREPRAVPGETGS